MEVIRVTETETIVVDTETPTVVVSGLMGPPGPQGPTGPQGQGLAIDQAVTSLNQLPTTGTQGQTIFVQETGKIYIWSGL